MPKQFHMLYPFEVRYSMGVYTERMNYGLRLQGVPEQWKLSKGEGVTVAVIDTGFPRHDEFDGQILCAMNFTNSPIEDSVQGHSTHVCGIIAAKENNIGVVGGAPNAKLIVVKALNDSGSGTDESISNAILFAIDQKADIINMSLGAANEVAGSFRNTQAAIELAASKGIICIAASGNESSSKVAVPACFPECISVGAVDSEKERANFSNIGDDLDFVGVGVDIFSTYLNNSYATLSGTSMATPIISAIAALVLSEHRNRKGSCKTLINNVSDMREHLRKISLDLGKFGVDEDYGWGLPIFSASSTNTLQNVSLFSRVKKWFFSLF